MFGLTLDFIRGFKLPIGLSCQCFRPFQHKRWGSLNHDIILNLSSSMINAERQKVFSFHFEEHFIHCVRGFHPASLYRADYERKQTLDKILRQLFHSLFEPCAPWQNENLEKSPHRKTKSIQILFQQLRQSAAEYDELRMRGPPPAMSQHGEGSITAEQWDNPRKALNLIVQLLSPNTAKNSPL